MTIRLVALWLVLVASAAQAHELRPAYLDMTETRRGAWDVRWKVPRLGDRAPSIRPLFPAICRAAGLSTTEALEGAAIESSSLDCGPESIVGRAIEIENLAATMSDVLVRIEFADGRTQTNLLKPAAPAFTVVGRRPALEVARDYLALGVEHILGGGDHLLFVLGLVLIVPGLSLLLKTITAFTVAHSVTLGLASLGLVHVPQAPVEATIALSVAFLARELLGRERGEESLTARRPWLVALAFGFLHGLGFAGALAEVGLPEGDIPLALLAFNTGVEVGQLLFVAGVLAATALSTRLAADAARALRPVSAYAIGAASCFWLIERIGAFHP